MAARLSPPSGCFDLVTGCWRGIGEGSMLAPMEQGMHALDTDKAWTRLEAARICVPVAEAMVEIFDTASTAATADLATTSDIRELDDRVEKLEAGVETLRTMQTDMRKSTIGSQIGVGGLVVAAVKLL